LPGSLNMHNEYTEASASRAPSIDKLRHELWMEKGGGAAAAVAKAAGGGCFHARDQSLVHN
jgi:hypothetical protein